MFFFFFYPNNANKKRVKVLEVLGRKAKEVGLNFASLIWIIPPHREEPSQILVAVDDVTAASIRNFTPVSKLGTLLTALTSSTTNSPQQCVKSVYYHTEFMVYPSGQMNDN